jgi:hypothetical protein
MQFGFYTYISAELLHLRVLENIFNLRISWQRISGFNNVPTMVLKDTIDDGYQLSDGSTRKPRGKI